MTQSINDVSHGHDALHRLYEGDDFKFREYGDPEGANYAALKKFLLQHLEPASFKTYWSFIKSFEPYVYKAMSPVVIKSGVKACGFDADNKINVLTIMSFNPQFAEMKLEKAQKLVRLIESVLAPYFSSHSWIPEIIYDELLGDDPDITLLERIGTPLNNLCTNRQRFMIDNSCEWQAVLHDRETKKVAAIAEIERKRVEREARIAALPSKSRQCSHLGCVSIIDITTPTLKKANEATWKKCKGKNCSTWACLNHLEGIEIHQINCVKCFV